jgi:hypothetical protein
VEALTASASRLLLILLLPVGGLAAQVLDHPAGGIGLGGEGLFVALLGKQGSLQLC